MRAMRTKFIEDMPKTQIIQCFKAAIERSESCQMEFIEKKTRKVIAFTLTITERETFVDENGVKWVRA